jgi:hypothetical protein
VGNESLVKALLLAHSGFSFLGFALQHVDMFALHHVGARSKGKEEKKLCQSCCSFLKTRALQHVNMSPPHMHSPCSSLLLSQTATHLT